jgi:hypothetical protein
VIPAAASLAEYCVDAPASSAAVRSASIVPADACVAACTCDIDRSKSMPR